MQRTRDFRRKKAAMRKKYIHKLQEKFDVWKSWTYRNEGKTLESWSHDKQCMCVSCRKGRERNRLRDKELEKLNRKEDLSVV